MAFLLFLVMAAGSCKSVDKEKTSGKEEGARKETMKEERAQLKEGRRVTSENKRYIGRYQIRMTGFQGDLVIQNRGGVFAGTIRFDNWGKGQAQALKNVIITGRKIYFIRSITTGEELEKFGAKRYFQQEFYGRFSEDGRLVRGYFKDSGGQNSWEGRR